jgi:acetyl-CoA synthetase
MSASTLARLADYGGSLQAQSAPAGRGTSLRAVALEGGASNDPASSACEAAFGVRPNAIISTPETGCIVCQSHEKWPSPPGSAGKAVPGHQLAVLDSRGAHSRKGAKGTLALNRHDIHGHPDPSYFLGYWRCEPATQARQHGPWFLTREQVRQDDENNYWV